MSTIRLMQRLRELSHALENCETEEEREAIEDEIAEIEEQIEDENEDTFGHKQTFR